MPFIIHELAIHPDIQISLRKEIDNLQQNSGGIVDYDSISNLKYFDMVLSESFRRWSPVQFNRYHIQNSYVIENSNATHNKLKLNVGDTVWLPMYAFHMDEKYFTNPEKFDPERFNERNIEKIKPISYNPFGIQASKLKSSDLSNFTFNTFLSLICALQKMKSFHNLL